MSTLDALRQAVLASPDDDLPRLVFADYLEENGDPDRAAFIRAQIELAKTPEYEPFAVLCKTRKREWVTGDTWRGTLPHFHPGGDGHTRWHDPPFRRGFGYAVNVGFLLAAHRGVTYLLEAEPVGELHIGGSSPLDQWRQFSKSKWLTRIRSVALTGLSSPNEPLRSLRESPYTSGITSLRLETTNFPSIPIILEELFAAPLGKQLTSLSMRHGYGSADETMEAIAQNGEVSLTDYDLFHMGFGPTAARTFADTGLAGQAEVLRLNGNALTSNGLSILATSVVRLRVLDLSKTSLAPVAAELMSQAPAFRSLRKLILDGNPLGTDGIKAISHSQHLTGLRSLGLANTQCDNAAVRYLTRRGVWPNLVEVDLRNNPISDTGAKHLLSAPPAPELTSLMLPTRNLTDDMKGELVARFGEVVAWAD
jgi:uncharacterized protein (TIGR02996 family)